MDLVTYVKQRVADGALNALQIHADIVRPSVVSTAGKEARKTANLEEQLRALLVPSIINKVQWENAPDRDDAIAQRFDLALGKANQSDAEFIAVMRTKARFDLLRARIERQGGDPTGADAGKAERDTVAKSEGPALWQTWGIEKPSLRDVREAMR